ncbi:hypothetical protein [Mycobacterium sp. SMC-19]|uniref:hypothetical protein n=1 Tax=Mycobacterium sp. SMC-19 TaxID=3381630 RepID=UPI0038774547
MAKQTIASLVNESIGTLRGLDRAGLRVWAIDRGLDSASGFSRFKKALADNGIDYAALGQPTITPTAELTLYSDAKVSADRFGIVFGDDDPAWYGKFFGEVGEQSRGEMEAAKKAVWYASKVAERTGHTLRLNLFVDAQWLWHANGDTGGGKAAALRDYARRLGVVLHVEWIPGSENPADEYTVCSGYVKWTETIYAAAEHLSEVAGTAA